MTQPSRVRRIIPALGAFAEELVFRGGVFMGLCRARSPFIKAALVSSLLLCLGQVVLVPTPVQLYIMASASLTCGMVGCLLVAATGSLIPVLILHTSFATYCTNMSTSAVQQTTYLRGKS